MLRLLLRASLIKPMTDAIAKKEIGLNAIEKPPGAYCHRKNQIASLPITKEGTRKKVRIGNKIKTAAINKRNAPSVIFIQSHKAELNFLADIGTKHYIDIRNTDKIKYFPSNSERKYLTLPIPALLPNVTKK
ncbi:MAG TPA: hypothetical protein DCY88_19035 [Cyanobacteria bacterium UBA11372]|nr:hypothetical protein [Cyanobacteria bacterium UBA11372]HBE52029.1 hypothetical protein [Cyanobacteria bacterium UBA11369]